MPSVESLWRPLNYYTPVPRCDFELLIMLPEMRNTVLTNIDFIIFPQMDIIRISVHTYIRACFFLYNK